MIQSRPIWRSRDFFFLKSVKFGRWWTAVMTCKALFSLGQRVCHDGILFSALLWPVELAWVLKTNYSRTPHPRPQLKPNKTDLKKLVVFDRDICLHGKKEWKVAEKVIIKEEQSLTKDVFYWSEVCLHANKKGMFLKKWSYQESLHQEGLSLVRGTFIWN